MTAGLRHKGESMTKRASRVGRLVVAVLLIFCVTTSTGGVSKAPESVQAALFVKLLAFHKGVASGEQVVVYVADAGEFATELRKAIGQKIGAAKLVEVTSGSDVPETKPTVIYVGTEELVASLTAYARKHDVLTITGVPELAKKGVSLGVGMENDKPAVLLNPSASKQESAEWDPAIFKIARTVD